MAKDLDFGSAIGGFTLCLAEGSNSYIFLAIFSPFLWTHNKVWEGIKLPPQQTFWGRKMQAGAAVHPENQNFLDRTKN
jgi:hypothetical protein